MGAWNQDPDLRRSPDTVKTPAHESRERLESYFAAHFKQIYHPILTCLIVALILA